MRPTPHSTINRTVQSWQGCSDSAAAWHWRWVLGAGRVAQCSCALLRKRATMFTPAPGDAHLGVGPQRCAALQVVHGDEHVGAGGQVVAQHLRSIMRSMRGGIAGNIRPHTRKVVARWVSLCGVLKLAMIHAEPSNLTPCHVSLSQTTPHYSVQLRGCPRCSLP